MATSTRVVRAYFAAWPTQDRMAVEALVAEDFHFTSPLDNRLDRDTFFSHCWPNSATIASLDIKRLVPDQDIVYVTYELTQTDGRRFRNSEVLTVSGDQVREVEVYFGWDLPHKASPGGFVNDPLDGASR